MKSSKKSIFRDPLSGFLHVPGILVGMAGVLLSARTGLQKANPQLFVACLIYSFSLLALFTSSVLYHLLNVSDKTTKHLRQIDHMMIFVFIAGSYTPFCLITLRGAIGWGLCALVWIVAAAGIIMKIYWMHAPRWLYTLLYVIMGWLSVAVIYPLYRNLAPAGFFWLVGGGLFYTIGALIYALRYPNPAPLKFGFHEIWHVFVLLGSLAHFITVFVYIV